jgi:hypothetical protein
MRAGWAEHVAVMGEVKKAYMISGKKYESKRTLGRSRSR